MMVCVPELALAMSPDALALGVDREDAHLGRTVGGEVADDGDGGADGPARRGDRAAIENVVGPWTAKLDDSKRVQVAVLRL